MWSNNVVLLYIVFLQKFFSSSMWSAANFNWALSCCAWIKGFFRHNSISAHVNTLDCGHWHLSSSSFQFLADLLFGVFSVDSWLSWLSFLSAAGDGLHFPWLFLAGHMQNIGFILSKHVKWHMSYNLVLQMDSDTHQYTEWLSKVLGKVIKGLLNGRVQSSKGYTLCVLNHYITTD